VTPRARVGRPRCERKEPDTEEPPTPEEVEVDVFDHLGTSIATTVDLGPGIRLRHAAGGLPQLARELGSRPRR
jgi:hypothetical protein